MASDKRSIGTKIDHTESVVKRFNGCHLLGSELKIKNLNVGFNSCGSDRLGNDHNITLHLKANQYLSGTFAVFIRNSL